MGFAVAQSGFEASERRDVEATKQAMKPAGCILWGQPARGKQAMGRPGRGERQLNAWWQQGEACGTAVPLTCHGLHLFPLEFCSQVLWFCLSPPSACPVLTPGVLVVSGF